MAPGAPSVAANSNRLAQWIPDALVVLARAQPKMHLRTAVKDLVRDEVALAVVRTVRGERVEVACDVLAPDQSVAISTRRVAAQDYDISMTRRPFALDPPEVVAAGEDHVVTSAFAYRSVDIDAKLHGGSNDRSLGGVPFLIGREH
ncbi:MAG TPA: hypothetical protein VLB89_04325 [Gaiellaceae bacterium]|nr:hypothetical protein [Gaiellaceae bacterium]